MMSMLPSIMVWSKSNTKSLFLASVVEGAEGGGGRKAGGGGRKAGGREEGG